MEITHFEKFVTKFDDNEAVGVKMDNAIIITNTILSLLL